MSMGKGGRAFLVVVQLRQHTGGNPFCGGRLIVEIGSEALDNQPEPIRLDQGGGAVLIGIRHARPLRTRARDAGAYLGGNPL